MMHPTASGSLLDRHRLEALTDGVYAIALTLLVLDLRLPVLPDGAAGAALSQALLQLIPKGLTWLLSFWVTAMFWLGQARTSRLSASLDGAMVPIELLQLALISLLPFSTALIGEHGDRVAAAALYSAHLLGLAVLSWIRTSHLLRHPSLQTEELTSEVARAFRIRIGLLTGSAAATLVLAFFWPGWNMLAMLPTILISRLARL